MPRRLSSLSGSTNVSIARVCQAVLLRSSSVQTCDDVDKRYIVYDYLCSVRYRLLRILMIIQWVARSKGPLEQLTTLNDYIDKKERVFRRCAYRLCIQAAQLDQLLYPQWDVETAMHLFCHGRYPWFQNKSRRWPQRQEILGRMNSLIRRELARSVITKQICSAQRKIQDGRLLFVLSSGLSITLTLRIHDEQKPHILYWHVLHLDFRGKSRNVSLEQECNRMLFEHSAPETALSSLFLYLNRYSDKERFKMLQQDVSSLSDHHSYINVKVIPDDLVLDIHYWQSERSFLPIKGNVTNANKGQAPNAIIRISIDPPSVQHIPYFFGDTDGLSLSQPLSGILETIISRRTASRIRELASLLESSPSDMICWDRLVAETSLIRIFVLGAGKTVTFPDGFFVEISVNPESGLFQLSSPISFKNSFWHRLLSKLSSHLNASVSILYQVLLAVSMNAFIEHFSLLASLGGFDAFRRCPDADLHSLYVRIPRFSSHALFIQLGPKSIEFKICCDVSAGTTAEVIELDFGSLIASSACDDSKSFNMDTVMKKNPLFFKFTSVVAQTSLSRFHKIIQCCQSRIILCSLLKQTDPCQFAYCNESLVCWKIDKPREVAGISPLYVLLSTRNEASWTAKLDCIGFKMSYINSLPYFNETPGFSVNIAKKCMEISYPIDGTSSVQSNALSQCRTDVLTFVQMASLVSRFLSHQAMAHDHDFEAFRHFRLSAVFHKKAYFKLPSGLTVVIGTYIIKESFYYSVQFLPRALPHRQYLEHLLNSDPDGLRLLFSVLYESEILLNATLDFAQSCKVIDYISPDIDIVPESPNWLRVVFRSGKLSVQSWADIIFLPDKSARVELVPRSEEPLRCFNPDQLIRVLSEWKTKCLSFAEFNGVYELLRRKESSNDASQWADNGVVFRVSSEEKSVAGIDCMNQEYIIIKEYAAAAASGNRLTGLARICYSPPVSFQQSLSIFRSIQFQAPGFLQCQLMLQCKLPWGFSHVNEVLALCVAFGDPSHGTCVLRLQMSIPTGVISLYGKDSDTTLLGRYLEGWDKASFGSAILLLRRRSLSELARLKNK